MTKPFALIAVTAGLAVAGCGDSASDKAQTQVCDARADISKQVDTLAGLTVSSATTQQITSSLDAIKTDLGKISDAQGDLSDDRKQELQSANKEFTSQVSSIAGSLLKTTSASEASTQLQSAFDQLSTSYKDTLAKLDC